MELIERALRMAVIAHQDQKRKDDQSPYIVHPVMVSRIVERHGFAPEVVAAALVHDVLEDTPVTEATLRTELGDDVADIVVAVSEDKSQSWEVRKESYIAQVVAASEAVRAVSTADKIHNLASMEYAYNIQGPALWEKFSRGPEKTRWFYRALYEALTAGWTHPMLEEYRLILESFERTVAANH